MKGNKLLEDHVEEMDVVENASEPEIIDEDGDWGHECIIGVEDRREAQDVLQETQTLEAVSIIVRVS
jgi:predicted fused transcriptional regulator/phosphomethylpyrimidine kinase